MVYQEKHMPTEAKAVNERIGWGKRMGFGERPALLVIDMAKAWCDPESPMGTDMSVPLANINKVLAVARQITPVIPIIFTVMWYVSAKEASPVMMKKRGEKNRMELLRPGSKWVEIDPVLNRRPDEFLLVKKHDSCFTFTNLSELLTLDKVDTVIITGCSTSGCVMATAIDSCAHGYHTIVVEEAVGDRDPSMAAFALLNIDLKHGDLVSVDEVIKYLARFKS